MRGRVGLGLGACAALIVVALGTTLVLGANRMEAWAAIVRLIHALQALAAISPLAAAGLYILVYAALVAACVPLGPAMSLTGGVLFGFAEGTVFAMVGIVLGCVTCFSVARSGLAAELASRRIDMLDRIRPRLQADGAFALLSLRLAPVVPSWMLNLGAGLAGMRLVPFALATTVGVLPATMVFTSAGAGLGSRLSEGDPPGLDLVLRPEVLWPLLALSVLALVPTLLRWRRSR